ncbi:putative carboxylesterase [Helianthus annuus]|nr:putative carboxylesterase [Helianthus annuus]KAJ0640265.1 putative carboxylesterase [Helianthus annuus]KAJ0644215.1 putative carboxylesterase [Helianthus annuus]KAJ0820471.1 putative carboxylesterase [Helianthus annuus]KAJ0835078.1 putative carboxylesterase [Helianthus annuus]
MSSVFGSGEISTSDEYLHEITGFIRVHKDGHCERLLGNNKLPAGIDSSTGVESKDVVISPETNVSARLYIPKSATSDRKLPIMIYFHGGGFVFESTTSAAYHSTLNRFTAELNVISVSVDYRLGPEYPVPAGYNDSWEATHWVASHSAGCGPDTWLNEFADFSKVFLAGDSAGANIAHNLAIRFGSDRIAGINLEGIILIHPYFGGNDPIGSELGKHKQLKAFTDQFWNLANPSGTGLDDPLFNPEKDPNLSGLGCSKILLAVAEKDSLRDRGLHYKELMEKSGWAGKVEMLESKDEDHAFFLFDQFSQNTSTLCNRICTFIN